MRKYLAEFIGTFVLTFTACGAASFTGGSTGGVLGVVGIALVFGLTFIAMAYSIGNVSGCHINPAVSVGMFASGRMSGIDFIGYVLAQLLGGIAAGGAMFGLTKSFDQQMLSSYKQMGFDIASLGTNGYGEQSAFLKINAWGAVTVEIILSFIFVIAVLGVTAKEEYKNIAGLVIGFSLSAVHLFGVMLTGTSVNPARSFGPAFVKAFTGDTTALSQVWVFIIGPVIGALLAAVVYMLLANDKKAVKETAKAVKAADKSEKASDEKDEDEDLEESDEKEEESDGEESDSEEEDSDK